jgi:hypothetical protein
MDVHVSSYRQLYKQLSMKKGTSDEMALALGLHVKHWQRWAAPELSGTAINLVCARLEFSPYP